MYIYKKKNKMKNERNPLQELKAFLTENPHATHEVIYWELERLINLEKISPSTEKKKK